MQKWRSFRTTEAQTISFRRSLRRRYRFVIIHQRKPVCPSLIHAYGRIQAAAAAAATDDEVGTKRSSMGELPTESPTKRATLASPGVGSPSKGPMPWPADVTKPQYPTTTYRVSRPDLPIEFTTTLIHPLFVTSDSTYKNMHVRAHVKENLHMFFEKVSTGIKVNGSELVVSGWYGMFLF